MKSGLRSTHRSVVLLSAASSTDITRALLRYAESQAPPQTCCIRIFKLMNCSDGSVHSSSGLTVLWFISGHLLQVSWSFELGQD